MRETTIDLPVLPGGAIRLIGWAVRPGQAVRRGQTLCVVAQDGQTLDVPSLQPGTIRSLLATPDSVLAPAAALVALAASQPEGEQDIALPGGSLHLRRWLPAKVPRGTTLLLHGFAGGLEGWGATAGSLRTEGFAVVAPDLPAHGATTVTAETPQAMATLLAQAWAAMEMQWPVHLVGHSLGGAVALLLAAAQPTRVASLTLLAPLGFVPLMNGGFVRGVLAARDKPSLAIALRPLTARLVALPPAALAVSLAGLRRHGESLARLAAAIADGDRQRLDLRGTLASLPVPARLVVGDADAVLPWGDVAPPPHVPLHRLACGHMPHWEQHGAIRRLLAFTDWNPTRGDTR